MALQSSGTISHDNIQTEFGGANPISLSEYYRGGTYVPNISQNNSIPTSGTISEANFYSTQNKVYYNITISANTNNYVLNTAKVLTGYVAGVMVVTLTINSGVYVSSTTTGAYALTVDTSWAAGDEITIINNGVIVGRGGTGGTGGTSNAPVYGGPTNGGAGGPALLVQRSCTIQNNGTIAGGGGGGGGGGGATTST